MNLVQFVIVLDIFSFRLLSSLTLIAQIALDTLHKLRNKLDGIKT